MIALTIMGFHRAGVACLAQLIVESYSGPAVAAIIRRQLQRITMELSTGKQLVEVRTEAYPGAAWDMHMWDEDLVDAAKYGLAKACMRWSRTDKVGWGRGRHGGFDVVWLSVHGRRVDCTCDAWYCGVRGVGSYRSSHCTAPAAPLTRAQECRIVTAGSTHCGNPWPHILSASEPAF